MHSSNSSKGLKSLNVNYIMHKTKANGHEKNRTEVKKIGSERKQAEAR